MTTRKNNSLTLRAIEGDLLPEEETYQASLRASIYNAISTSDVADVVKSITEKAKAGDPAAQKLFFDYLLGQKTKPSSITVHNHFTSAEQGARISKSG